MKKTSVKICGITRPEDAKLCAELGADAIGLVFYAPSPRAVTVAQAAAIVRDLPPFLSVVALFVNPTREEVEAVLQALPVDILQFHGDETCEFCEQFHRPYLKALRVKDGENWTAVAAGYPSAKAILLDAFDPHQAGGTGQSFDWQAARADISRPVVLAGGIARDNVRRAIEIFSPAAVDLSSSVETAPGIKDAQKLIEFFQEFHHVIFSNAAR